MSLYDCGSKVAGQLQFSEAKLVVRFGFSLSCWSWLYFWINIFCQENLAHWILYLAKEAFLQSLWIWISWDPSLAAQEHPRARGHFPRARAAAGGGDALPFAGHSGGAAGNRGFGNPEWTLNDWGAVRRTLRTS